ncbi:MAG: prolipoprotein diacylglyceryl transferase [Acidobacteriota bacterium]|jgi:phosphatidylglycerol:prolipoprotein diacylglycerol transferase|nr:prolipoprotein diacylglyceryl transferase [Acidobacteriota bacterium]
MHPKLLEFDFFGLGPVAMHTYGLLLAIAFLAGIWTTSRNARKEGISPDSVWNLGLVILFAALVGSKVLLLVSDFSHYAENPRDIFSLSTLRSMGVYYGGLILALAAAAWYMRRRKLPAWRLADCAAPGIAIGQAIGRIGCLSAGCCYGAPTDRPWGIRFTDPYTAENMGTPLNIPLHPTQLYESAGTLLLFGYLMWRRSRPHRTGQVMLEYLGIYAVLRFGIEFFRADDRGEVLHGLLSTSQFIAVLMLLAAVALSFYIRRGGAAARA